MRGVSSLSYHQVAQGQVGFMKERGIYKRLRACGCPKQQLGESELD